MELAEELVQLHDAPREVAPFSQRYPGLTSAAGYAAAQRLHEHRVARGWKPVGRKIGFTNRTIWPRYGVYQPMWAHLWTRTVHFARDGKATLPLQGFVQPRIEPEMVFKLKGPVPLTDDPAAVLASVEWMAPGFEIVQSHFPDWKFSAADCAAAFGLHGALVVGAQVAITDANRAALAAALPAFEVTLSRGGAVIDRGVGSNVLDSPALALAHLARLLADQPQASKLAAGEIVTTGTITDAWPVAAGEVWSSDYGALGLDGLTLRFTAQQS
jgi:2-oxo-3-hexenedioate decarboxylase